jgi:hypothetical protein
MQPSRLVLGQESQSEALRCNKAYCCAPGEDRSQLADKTSSLTHRSNIFVRNQIHAISSRSDQTSFPNGIQGTQLVKRDGLMHKVNRHEFDGAESSIDPSNQLVDGSPQRLVLFHVLSRRNGDLNQDDLSNPLGVLLQEDFQPEQLLRHAFDVVQPVDAHDDLDVLESSLELLDPRFDVVALKVRFELLGINTDGKSADMGVAAIVIDTVGHSVQPEDASARGQEMASVVVSVETDQVAIQYTFQDFTTDR